MEPRQSEQPVESRAEIQKTPARGPERNGRFRIVKLEERIAPSSASTHGKCLSGHHTACCY
jgi:hypothetical protein